VTWAQLGIHAKPIGLLNVAGFYDGLARFVDHMVGQGFVRPAHAALLSLDASPEALVQRLMQRPMAGAVAG
jgi:predicted Rossmann-fold nucleotide-binding protein